MDSRLLDAAFGEAGAAHYDERWKPVAALRDSLNLQTALVFRPLPTGSACLCVGAGTGAELLALATQFPAWRFTVVEPAQAMLEICKRNAAAAGIAERCSFHQGFVHELDSDPRFDAATAILVSQFITDREPRIDFYRQIAKRLKPNGLLVSADLILPPVQHRPSLFAVWGELMTLTGTSPAEIPAKLQQLTEQVALVEDDELDELMTKAGLTMPVPFAQNLLIRARFAGRGA